ncbi:hypothetical protein [Lignipirellula cremea]|uniref:Chromosome partition protein Smc n=1 Tax=Lignipirellula cremea TaxID=2528010 RepID=A0A518E4X3_9BACT|nr:hypothetical protein [Lignipirellula cremea]QDU99150.1 Chromosome partition protein Smc [Lignipirellula cremea]
MLKKSLIVGAGVLLLSGLLVGPRNVCSYVSTGVSKVRGTFKDSVPIAFELDRARQMVKDLEPEIRHHTLEIAKVEVDVDRLARDLENRDERLANQQAEMLELKSDLAEGGSVFVYNKRHYTSDQVKADLTSRFEQFKTESSTRDNMRQILDARRQGLDAARQKLVEMNEAKSQLRLEIAHLESQLKILEVAKTRSEYKFDDSSLSRTKNLIDDIRTRIQVESKLANSEFEPVDRIPVGVKADDDRDIAQEITEFFAEKPSVDGYVGAEK